jgi:hypothetical protein
MKKAIALLFLVSSSFLVAQSSDDSTSSKVKAEFYIGVGATIQNQFNLNSRLKNSALPELNETTSEFIVGLNFFAEKFSGDAEFGFGTTQNDNANDANRNISFTSRLRGHYNIVNKEKYAFTGGLNIAATSNQVDIYSKNNAVDLNNINTLNYNQITLRNQMFFVGPSVSMYLLKHKSSQIRLNLGYELAFTNGKWKSDFGFVNNTVKETGNNRLVFGITLL